MIIIDAGHGGFDPGGGSNIYFKEKDLTKKISDYQYERFIELGLPVVKVRINDETLNPSQRIERINNLDPQKSDILISNHINSGGSSGGEIIYSIKGSNELPLMISNELKKSNLPIRNVYTRRNSLGKDYYFILRETIPNQAMIIEYGFADNNQDTYRLLYNWPELAESVVKAVTNYYQIPYIKPKNTTYIVKPNDSLYSIATSYNTSVEDIKTLNNLSSDTIYPGATLIIS